jgi:F0F1-type ATP synthase delta subunit
MTRKQILQLVSSSYSKNKLDDKKVSKIASLLKRKDLKSYVRALKLQEKKSTVNIALPSAAVYNSSKRIFFDLFPGKSIIISEDKLLLLGGKIVADDMVYDFSLKNKLENFLTELEDTYDEE